MKKSQHHKRTGKSPHWLVLGALASTAFSARPALSAQEALAEKNRDRSAYREPTPPALLAQRLDLGLAVPAQNASARRFDIPPGPLGQALDAFQEATGLSVEVADESIRDLGSPGVQGVFTAEKALQELLAGTNVTFRFTASTTVMIELPPLSETLNVTAPSAPVSPKYTEPLRDVPQTVMVIPRGLIEEQGATTLRDALRNVTGISIQAGEGGGGLPGDNLTIRGFAARNDIFMDGVRDFGSYTRDLFNVEQVEIVKGPASLYMGRGSTGGSLNMASKTPGLGAARSATLGAGTDEYGRATVDVNQPVPALGEHTAFRVNAMWTNADTPGRDAVGSERWGIAPSLAFGLGTPTRTTLSYSRLDQDNVPEYGLPWVPATNVPLAAYANQAAPVDFDNFYGLTDRDYEKTVTDIATAEVAHDFTDSLSLRSLVRHGSATRDSIITAPRFASNDSTAINRQLQSRDLTDAILSQQNDLTFHFETGTVHHAFVTGTEVARETSENHARTGPTAPTADLFDPNPGDPYTGLITRTGARTESEADTAALYASDTLRLNEKWEVSAGLRWDYFKVDFLNVAVSQTAERFDRTDRMLSWRGGVVHKPAQNGSVYVSAGTSFNPSADGNTGLSLTASTADLAPEKSRTYEIGTKWDFPASRLFLTGAVFRTEKVNARTPGVNPGDPPTVLQGEQRIDGFEIGVTGNLTNRWSTFFGYTYLDSEVVESNTPAEVGSELTNTPEHSASLWTTYRVLRGFEIGAGAQYVDERLNNLTTRRYAPDYLLFDAMASYDFNQGFTLRLNLFNLTDERYIDRVGGGHFIPGTGQSVALTTAIGF